MNNAEKLAQALRALLPFAETQAAHLEDSAHDGEAEQSEALAVAEACRSAAAALAEYDKDAALVLPTDFRVTWDIDTFNATTPREAAEEAWLRMRRVDSTANVFTVYGRDGSETVVDLSEDEE